METNRIELVSELAHALAILPKCHGTLMRIYNRDPGKYFAAAQSCTEKNNPAIYCGRAEHQIMGLRALGVLAAGDPKEIALILRAADRRVFDALNALEPGAQVVVDDYLYTLAEDENPDTFYARTVVAMGVCAVRSLVAVPSEGTRMMLESINLRRRNAAYRGQKQRNDSAVRAMKERLRVTSANGITGLYDTSSDDVRAKMERMLIMLNEEGIDAGVYTSGVLLSPLDAEILTENCDAAETIQTAVMLMLARAIKMDRDFCLTMYREDKTAEAEAEKREAENARNALKVAEKRSEDLQDEIRALEKERDALKRELESHIGDTDELAALRSAVYAAGRDQEEIDDAERLREIPEGIIAIGGHPTWAKLMRESTNIRVWPVGTTCPPSVITAASEIWIQSAYMDHSSFYAAIAAARRANIPVRYFSGTGVARCISDLKGV